tara:strand:- start:524 stop:940 length:417 start_codon:yes stop_codon:yes gene_type:complete
MSKKEEVANMLIAAAFDTSLKKLNSALASRGIEITSKTITTVIKISMEIVEATNLKGIEQKILVEKLVRKVVKDAPIADEKEKLLLDMIDEGVVGDVVDLVVAATNGEVNVNAAEKAAVGCCLAILKSRQQNKTNNKI